MEQISKSAVSLVLALVLVQTGTGFLVHASEQSEYKQQVQAAIALHDAGDYQGAIAGYRALLDVNPKDPWVLYEIAYSSLLAGHHEAAIKYAKRSVAVSSDYKLPCSLVLASSYDLLGKWKKGEKALRVALEEFPDNPLVHYNLGVNLESQGEFEEATTELQAAILLKPDHANSWRALAQTQKKRGYRARALVIYTRYLTVAPESTMSAAIAGTLWDQLFAGVTHDPMVGKDGKGETTITTEPPPDKNDSDAMAAESVSMALVAASRFLDEHTSKTDVQYFAHALEKVVTILWELDEHSPNQQSFWSRYVISYFRSAAEAGHLEAMAYEIRRSLENEEIGQWIQSNREAVDAYRKWHKLWQPAANQPDA